MTSDSAGSLAAALRDHTPAATPVGSAAGESDCGKIELVVEDTRTGRLVRHSTSQPFTIIGRCPTCDVHLADSQVSRRHAYLQLIGRRVACFDLDSTNGVHWSDGPRRADWIGSSPVRMGPYHIRHANADATDNLLTGKSPLCSDVGPNVDAGLQLMNGSRIPLRHQVTLVGRHPICALRIDDSRIAPVQCSFVVTDCGFSFVDLSGRNDMRVNGRRTKYARLSVRDNVQMGPVSMKLIREPLPETDHSQPQQRPVSRAASNNGMLTLTQAEGFLNAPALMDARAAPEKRPHRIATTGHPIFFEELLLSFLPQVFAMHQSTLARTHRQMQLLTDCVSTIQQNKECVRECLHRITEISENVSGLRRGLARGRPRSGKGRTQKSSETATPPTGPYSVNTDRETEHSIVVTSDKAHQSSGSSEAANETQATRSPVPDQLSSTMRAEAGHDAEFDADAQIRVMHRISALDRDRNSCWSRILRIFSDDDAE